ncbi:Uncharacterised protein [Mycobacteroides abscessus subsp. abscessus]|nr:Uncharacterised protein [Mycobacteroides abscessus subsp. abscessus]
MVGLDVRGAGAAAGLHHIRVERALHQEFHLGLLALGRALLVDDLAHRVLEGPDELPADDLALLLGIGHALQLTEELVHRVDGHQLGTGGRDEILLHLLALARAQQSVIDEHAGQPVADGALHQGGRHRAVHAAGQAADRVAVADLRAHLLHQHIGDVRRCPARRDTRQLVQEPAQHLLAVRGMQHLGVVLHTGQPPRAVLERRDRRTRRGAGHLEALRRVGHRVTVAHPHRLNRGQAAVQHATVDVEFGAAVLAGAGVGHRAAERLRHRLEAVADAEDRQVQVEQPRIQLRRALGVHAGRATGQDHRERLLRRDLLHRGGMGNHLGVDARLADPASDQLGVLGTEVDDEDRSLGFCHRPSLVSGPAPGTHGHARCAPGHARTLKPTFWNSFRSE